jgi:hypothetical protein
MTKRDTESGEAGAQERAKPARPATARVERLAARLRDNLRRRKNSERQPAQGDDESKTS